MNAPEEITPAWFKQWRQAMGWSAAQAAAALGGDARNIRRREAGEIGIGRETMLACMALYWVRTCGDAINDATVSGFITAADDMPSAGRPKKIAAAE